MSLPRSRENLLDPNYPAAVSGDAPWAVCGKSAGTVNVPRKYTSVPTLAAEQGSEFEAVDHAADLLVKHGSVVFVPLATSIAGAIGATTVSGGGPDITLSGEPTRDAQVRIKITKAGGLGVGEFCFALDAFAGAEDTEITWSPSLPIPAGGTYSLGFGLTATFEDDDFALTHRYSVAVTCDGFNAADLTPAITALKSTVHRWDALTTITTKACGDATAHALLVAAQQAVLDNMSADSLYRRGMIPGERGTNDAVEEFANVVASRCLVAAGEARRVAAITKMGFGFPTVSVVEGCSVRGAGCKISTDLKRVKGNGLKDGGAVPGIIKLFTDERLSETGANDVQLATMTSQDGMGGFFVTEGWLKRQTGSNIEMWQLGRVIDRACEIVHRAQTMLIGSGFRVNPDGSMDERDALRWDDEINEQLVAALKTEANAEGFIGHVTDVRYRLSRAHNIRGTGYIMGSVGVVSLFYARDIVADVGFVASLPAQQGQTVAA